MDENTRKNLYAALSASFPQSCVERESGRIGYQHIVNRLNEVLGLGAFRAHRTITVKEVKSSTGNASFEAICDLTLELGNWVDGNFVTFAESLADGGHIASNEFDAQTGAFTSAFTKAAAGFGVGKQAYEGTSENSSPAPSQAAPRVSAPMMRVVRAPVTLVPAPTLAAAPNTGPAALRSLAGPQAQVSRVSGKQLAAIWSIGRKLGTEQSSLRAKVKATYGVQLESLTREQASQLITSLQVQVTTSSPNPTLVQPESLQS